MNKTFSQEIYQEKLTWIFNRFPSVQSSGFGNSSYKPGLEHMVSIENILGNPHNNYRTIHVAGTNGKGSVANMLSAAISSTGKKTGLYTSPHIVDFRERMRVYDPSTGELSLVNEQYVFDFICEYEQKFVELDLSFFEITTAMAFKWFSDQKVDVAVIEVGLGGRLDSTNIITPDLSVVTSIGLDHCSLLGYTRAAIASEKAGIIKPGVPAVVGQVDDEIKDAFYAKARQGSDIYYAQKETTSMSDLTDALLKKMDLQGEYQALNLQTVLCCLDVLKKDEYFSGLSNRDTVFDALCHTAKIMQFHGRWERLSSRPWVICDIGHNPPALVKNFSQLDSMLERGECSSLIMVYGIMADKDLDSIMPLMPKNATYVFTSPSSARSLSVDILEAKYRDFCKRTGRNTNRIFSSTSVKDAVSKAVKIAANYGDNPLVYIGGSTFVVSEAVNCF